MTPLLGFHIATGCFALVASAIAVTAPKGGALHARSGTGFVVAMLVLWVTASVLDLLDAKPGAAIGNVFIGYFVGTSWVAARRRDGKTSRFEIVACGVALAAAAFMVWGGLTGPASPTPMGRGPLFVLAGFCLLAGLLDLNVILRARLTAAQRISRHLWRMCAALFIATGSFFLGQQDAMPQAIRGSPVLVVLAFAPFGLMAFWLVRIRLGKRLRGALSVLGERPARLSARNRAVP